MVRAGRNAKEILISKISVTGLGDYTRNVGYKTGSITYEYETHSFGYDRAIRLFADVMDVEESGVLDCFVEAGAELQRTQVAPEGDAYTFSQIASTEGVTVKGEDLSEASAVDVLAALRAVTNAMDERQVSTSSRRWSSRQRRSLDDPGAMRRVDPGEIIGRSGRDRVAAIRAVAHADIDWHAARRAADMAAVVAIHRYRTRSEAHGSHLASLGSHIAGIGLALIIR